MPSGITFSDGGSITYTYAADGTKLRTVHKIGSATTTTDYCGNVVYENGVQKLLLTEEGYISLGDNKYHYYLKDHEGNNRVVINQSGGVEETNHYYPFGGLFASTSNVQAYKYNGKEYDSRKGLNWYDYGARHYDGVLGRFISIDPWSERYYSTNPYIYCGSNPIRFVDPDGRGWKDAWPYLQGSVSGNISLGLNVGFSFGIKGVDLSAQINAGSVQTGSDGLKVTSGVSVNTPIVGVSVYDNAYKLDAYKDVKEKGYTVDFLIWSEDHKEITTFDSTGRTYKKVDKTVKVETESNLSFSASLGVGGEIKINLEKIWNFAVELFK